MVYPYPYVAGCSGLYPEPKHLNKNASLSVDLFVDVNKKIDFAKGPKRENDDIYSHLPKNKDNSAIAELSLFLSFVILPKQLLLSLLFSSLFSWVSLLLFRLRRRRILLLLSILPPRPLFR